jgi:hypothetical protein
MRGTRAKGIKLAKSFEQIGVAPHRVDWKLQSGRLNPKEEHKIMRYLGARTIGEATDALVYGRSMFKGASRKELQEKKWVTNRDLKFARGMKRQIMK